MRRLTITTALILAMCVPAAFADKESHRKAALDLIEAANTREMIDQMQKAIKGMMEQQFKTADLPPEGREEAKAAQKEVMDWVKEFLAWEQMRDMYVDIYVDVFTEKELADLIDFYESPVGRMFVKKMPKLMERSMKTTQGIMQKKMPELQKRIRTAVKGVKQKYKGPTDDQEETGVSSSSGDGKK